MDKLEYKVGRFTLQPFRQLLEGDAPVSLGRKALDLLSVLAKANGALVTKSELMAAIWPDVIIEENAIQVHIVALRKVLGTDAELLSTVRGLGYRLTPTEERVSAECSDPEPSAGTLPQSAPETTGLRWSPRLLSVALAVTALAAALVASMLAVGRYHDRQQPTDQSGQTAAVPSIAVLTFQPADSSKNAKLFADGLASSIADALSRYNVSVIAPSSSLQLKPAQKAHAGSLLGADFIVDGRIVRNADKLTVISQISNTRKNILVYSFEVQQGSALSIALANQIATHLALEIDPRKFSNTLGRKFTGEDYVLMARANEAIDKWDILNVMDLSVQLAARHADDAELQASAGAATIFAAANLPEDQQQQSLQTARTYIDRARQLDPHSGPVYFAQSLLVPGPMDLAAQEALLRKSLRLSPNLPQTFDGLADIMVSVGRIDEGVSLFKRSVQLNPLSALHAGDALKNYIAAGRVAEASQLLEQAKLLWPDRPEFTFSKYGIAAAAGRPEEFLSLEKRYPLPWGPMRIRKADSDLMLRATMTKNKSLIGQSIAMCFRQFGKSLQQVQDASCFSMMVQMGALNSAFHFAELAFPDYRSLYPKDDNRWITKPLPGISTVGLFAPNMAAFRNDPRFWPVALRTGLVKYWQTTQQWPDFCRDQIDQCKMLAAETAQNSSAIRAASRR